MAAYYKLSLVPNEEDPTDIDIEPIDETMEIPKEYEALRTSIRKDIEILTDTIKPPRDKRKDLITKYYRVAKIAFGENPRLKFATTEIEEARHDLVKLVNELQIKRFTSHLICVGILLVILGVISARLNTGLTNFVFGNQTAENVNIVLAVSWTVVGIGASLLFLSFVRNRTVTYETLLKNNIYDYWAFWQIGYIVVITSLIFLLLYFNWIMIGIAGVTLNDVVKTPFIGFLIGFAGGAFPPPTLAL